jgi:hypothetical protein
MYITFANLIRIKLQMIFLRLIRKLHSRKIYPEKPSSVIFRCVSSGEMCLNSYVSLFTKATVRAAC